MRLEVEGNVLVVSVAERPAIAQIDFVGMKEFPADKVRKALRENGIAEGRTYDKALLDQAEQEIKRQYLATGRYGVMVTTTITPLDRNRVSVNFTIDEGEVAKIKAINIVGNQAFSEKELLDLMQLQTPGWLSWYTKNDQYSRQKLSADLETVRSYYLNRGYLDFNIDSTQVSITPDKRDIYITINVTEGDKYTVSDVKLGGELLLPEAELMRLVAIKPGESFSREKLADSTKGSPTGSGNEGYAFANANAVPDVDKDKRTVAFTIMIDPGRRVYVRRINVVGNTKTRDEVIRREMRQLEGSFYDGQRIQESQEAGRAARLLRARRGARDRAGDRDDRPGRRHAEGEGETDRCGAVRPRVLQLGQADRAGIDQPGEHLRQRQGDQPATPTRARSTATSASPTPIRISRSTA